MVSQTESEINFLPSENVAVLRRVAEREYVVHGPVPPFYRRLFPETELGPCADPWVHSDMLAFFLDDVEDFFAQSGQGTLSSGIWQEAGLHGQEETLMASAFTMGTEKVLVLRLLRDEDLGGIRILQKTREHLLEGRAARSASAHSGRNPLHNDL